MPSFESQATLPQYFLLKARLSASGRSIVAPLTGTTSMAAQEFPNYAPNAAPPLFSVKDWVVYESRMNPAVCRGTSLRENCMIDRFPIPVEA